MSERSQGAVQPSAQLIEECPGLCRGHLQKASHSPRGPVMFEPRESTPIQRLAEIVDKRHIRAIPTDDRLNGWFVSGDVQAASANACLLDRISGNHMGLALDPPLGWG